MNARSRVRCLLTCVLVLATAAAHAQALLSPPGPAPDEDPVAVSTAWSADRARPAGPLLLAVVLDIRPGYHVVADPAQLRPMGDFKPFPTRVRVSEAPDGVVAEPARFPRAQPLQAEFADTPLMSFEGRTVVIVPLALSLPSPAPDDVGLALAVEYQACAAAYCLMPQRLVVRATLPVARAGESVAPAHPELFQTAQSGAARRTPLRFDLFGASVEFDPASAPGLAAVLLLAAAGGFLLNLTPCVLPLVPVKIISLSQGTDRRRGRTLGLCTFAGVLLFWVGLGAVVSPASGFTSTHQLFQYPAFTLGVGAVIALMAVGMFGAYAVRLPTRVYAFNPRQDTAAGAVGMGVLTAVLSTPCTAPFMGTAAAWAATQAPAVTLATFAAIGAGMGLPYAVLAARPDWLRRVPKTGPWSELLKQVMGVFMLAAAAYFIGIGAQTLSADTGADPRLLWWPVTGLCALGGVWMGVGAARLAGTAAVPPGLGGGRGGRRPAGGRGRGRPQRQRAAALGAVHARAIRRGRARPQARGDGVHGGVVPELQGARTERVEGPGGGAGNHRIRGGADEGGPDRGQPGRPCQAQGGGQPHDPAAAGLRVGGGDGAAQRLLHRRPGHRGRARGRPTVIAVVRPGRSRLSRRSRRSGCRRPAPAPARGGDTRGTSRRRRRCGSSTRGCPAPPR